MTFVNLPKNIVQFCYLEKKTLWNEDEEKELDVTTLSLSLNCSISPDCCCWINILLGEISKPNKQIFQKTNSHQILPTIGISQTLQSL